LRIKPPFKITTAASWGATPPAGSNPHATLSLRMLPPGSPPARYARKKLSSLRSQDTFKLGALAAPQTPRQVFKAPWEGRGFDIAIRHAWEYHRACGTGRGPDDRAPWEGSGFAIWPFSCKLGSMGLSGVPPRCLHATAPLKTRSYPPARAAAHTPRMGRRARALRSNA
jgi:hypothetical protein